MRKIRTSAREVIADTILEFNWSGYALDDMALIAEGGETEWADALAKDIIAALIEEAGVPVLAGYEVQIVKVGDKA